MKPVSDRWSIVVAGAWNVRLFTPEWLSQNVLESKNLNIEMGIGAGIQAWRFLTEDSIFIPGDDKVILGVRSADIEVLKKSEPYARKLLELLPHTPIAGIGINFGFTCETPSDKLTQLFNLSDVQNLSKLGYQINDCTIARSLKIQNSAQNMNAKLALNNGVVQLDFNHHFAAKSAGEAKEFLVGTRVEEAFKRTIKFLADMYELDIDKDEEQQ